MRVLVSTGATIFGTARNLDKAKEALGELLDTGRVKLLFMDQTELSSVRACAEEFLKESSKLNVVINNAAVSLSDFLVSVTSLLQQYILHCTITSTSTT